ncbi:MAG: DNA polymerase III subunit delta [Gammaproteobacteria bacterium]|nr:DNA polymerase III subunit delta [Gammaproteobacteria bacterium]MDH5731422.1 DNA polymerase III subunit delta [Gammaproteobacteria bacterium]
MKIPSWQLNDELKKTIAPIYLVSGDEALLQIEAADAIRACAKTHGFSEREVMHVEKDFAWERLLESAGSMSLFAEKRVIELRAYSSKIGTAGSQVMQKYCEILPEDTLLLLTMPRIEKDGLRSKWLKQIEQVGVHVTVWPIKADKLPQWINQRLRAQGLNADREAVELLIERVEGNLLAAKQEIEKLALLCDQRVTAQDVLAAVGDSAQYDVFALAEAANSGDVKRFVNIFNGLRASGLAASLMLWALSRAIRENISPNPHAGAKANFNTQASHKRYTGNSGYMATPRPKSHYLRLLQHCLAVDQVIKGQRRGNEWDELLKLGFAMSGKPLLSN